MDFLKKILGIYKKDCKCCSQKDCGCSKDKDCFCKEEKPSSEVNKVEDAPSESNNSQM